jgi:hypothetical protein
MLAGLKAKGQKGAVDTTFDLFPCKSADDFEFERPAAVRTDLGPGEYRPIREARRRARKATGCGDNNSNESPVQHFILLSPRAPDSCILRLLAPEVA